MEEARPSAIRRAATRLSASGNARAIDLLFVSLNKVLATPTVERYRTINPKHPAMQPIVEARGGMEMLWAVGYEPIHGHLVLQHVDPQRLRGGLAALEEARRTPEYTRARNQLLVEHEMAARLKTREAQDATARAQYKARVPDEPPEGEAGSSLLCFHVSGKLVWRRFESCNTVQDILNFVRSLPELRPDAKLELKNVTTAPSSSLSAPQLAGYTLQRLDLWPSGHVAVEVH